MRVLVEAGHRERGGGGGGGGGLPCAVRECDFSDQELAYAKGEEIGQFRFGSTVIVLFGKNKVSGLEHLSPKAPVIMGEKLALLN